jgi:hypothetical protein
METNPLPPTHGQLDPWAQPGSPQVDPPPPMPPDDPDDLFGQLPQGGGAGGSTFMLSMFDKACSKLKTCPGIDSAMMGQICDQFSAIPKMLPPRSCPAAQRCLDAIDHLTCDQAGSNNPLAAVYLISDCATALNDC